MRLNVNAFCWSDSVKILIYDHGMMMLFLLMAIDNDAKVTGAFKRFELFMQTKIGVVKGKLPAVLLMAYHQ